MKYSKILASGSYLPNQVVTNSDLEKMVNTDDAWIMQRVGIRKRHIVGNGSESLANMAEQSCRQALADAGLAPNEIDLLIVATTTADFYFPSPACLLQSRLGIDNDCPAFDLGAACAGFIYAISVADQYIRSGTAKKVLVVGVDAYTKTIDWSDRTTCILFGDGAGAVILEASNEPGIITTHLHAAGNHANLLYSKSALWLKTEENSNLKMDGNALFKIAVKKLGDIVDQTLEKSGLKKTDIDWLVPHQANMRIIAATAKRLDLSLEKVILTIEDHGNTSAASVPLALDHALRSNRIKRGETLMLEAFGAGLTWGSALLKY